jgi:hypothetical protein
LADKQAVPGNFPSWRSYWLAQGTPWRKYPEIDEDRQHFLSEQQASAAQSGRSVYLFKDIGLTVADVEWLLAKHLNPLDAGLHQKFRALTGHAPERF